MDYRILASNNRFIDICPNQYCTISLQASDTPKQIVWTDQKIIPRRVSYDFINGTIFTSIEFEADTSGPEGVTVTPPQPIEENIDPGVDPGEFPIFPPPNINFPPWIPTPPPENPLCRERGSGPYAVYPNRNVIQSGEDETVKSLMIYYPCEIRDAGSWPTRLVLEGRFERDTGLGFALYNESNSWFTIEAVDQAGNVVANASSVSNLGSFTKVIYFAVGGYVNIWGLKITIGDDGTGFTVGSEVYNGEVPGDSTAGVVMTAAATPLNWYSVLSDGGPAYYEDGQYGFQGAVDFGSGFYHMGGYINAPKYAPPGYSNAHPIYHYWYRIGNYSRVFFQALSATLKFRFADSAYGDNSGSLNYTLNEAESSDVYRITLTSSYIYNICPVQAE